MEKLITAQEVIEMAFAGEPAVRVESVTEAAILSAEQKFVKPVVNDLWKELIRGEHVELTEKYIKPSLAHYVKLLLLPKLAMSLGSLGVVQYKSSSFQPVDRQQLIELKKQTKAEADTLMRRAVEQIEGDLSRYANYDRSKNILNRRSISSGVIL